MMYILSQGHLSKIVEFRILIARERFVTEVLVGEGLVSLSWNIGYRIRTSLRGFAGDDGGVGSIAA